MYNLRLGGTKANELKQLLDTGNITEYEAVFTKHNFKTYVFRLHAKLDDYQSRVSFSLSLSLSLTPFLFLFFFVHERISALLRRK
jgi:hypothetical protein